MTDIPTDIYLKEFTMSDFILVSIMVLGVLSANLAYLI
jgi:hypothetical protein